MRVQSLSKNTNGLSTTDKAVGARLKRMVISELRRASGPLTAEDLCEALSSSITDEIQVILDSAAHRGCVCFQRGGYCISPTPKNRKANYRRRPSPNMKEALPEASLEKGEALVSMGPISFRGLRFADRAELALFLAYLSFVQSEICLIVECVPERFWELIAVARTKEPWGPSISAGWRYATEHPEWVTSSKSLVRWAASLEGKERSVVRKALQSVPLNLVARDLGEKPDKIVDIARRSMARCPQCLFIDDRALSRGTLSCFAFEGD